MSNQLGFPKKCQDKANELLNAHGYDKAIETIDAKITKLRKAHARLDYTTNGQLKIDLACDVDFWSQTMQALTINK